MPPWSIHHASEVETSGPKQNRVSAERCSVPVASHMRPLLSVAEVAAYLNVSTKTVRRLIGRGELRSVRIGRSIRIPEEEIECLIAGRSSV